MEVKVSRTQLQADIEAGMKKEALAAKYTQGNKSALTGLLKDAGLRIKQFRVNKPKYTLVDTIETADMTATVQSEENSFEKLKEIQERNNSMA
jgi:hypothetical protein